MVQDVVEKDPERPGHKNTEGEDSKGVTPDEVVTMKSLNNVDNWETRRNASVILHVNRLKSLMSSWRVINLLAAAPQFQVASSGTKEFVCGQRNSSNT